MQNRQLIRLRQSLSILCAGAWMATATADQPYCPPGSSRPPICDPPMVGPLLPTAPSQSLPPLRLADPAMPEIGSDIEPWLSDPVPGRVGDISPFADDPIAAQPLPEATDSLPPVADPLTALAPPTTAADPPGAGNPNDFSGQNAADFRSSLAGTPAEFSSAPTIIGDLFGGGLASVSLALNQEFRFNAIGSGGSQPTFDVSPGGGFNPDLLSVGPGRPRIDNGQIVFDIAEPLPPTDAPLPPLAGATFNGGTATFDGNAGSPQPIGQQYAAGDIWSIEYSYALAAGIAGAPGGRPIPSPGVSVRRVKIAENFSPEVRNRFFTNYSFSLFESNATFGAGAAIHVQSDRNDNSVSITNSQFVNNTANLTLPGGPPAARNASSAIGGAVAIVGDGQLIAASLTNVEVRGNSGLRTGGLAIVNASVTVVDSIFDDNEATSFGASPGSVADQPAAGGGISLSVIDLPTDVLPELLVRRSTLSNNRASDIFGTGGGIGACDGNVTIESSVIEGNTNTLSGGGIGLFDTGTRQSPQVAFRDSILSNNQSGGGGALQIIGGGALIESSRLTGNAASQNGGAIEMSSQSEDGTASLVIRRSTIDNNRSGERGGGIMLFNGGYDFENLTLVGNQAGPESEGGGFRFSEFDDSANNPNAIRRLTYSTVASNTAGGAGDNLSFDQNEGSALTVQIGASIFADGTSELINTQVVSLGGNVDDADQYGFDQPSDLVNTDAQLGDLQDLGGPVPVRRPGNEAILDTSPVPAPATDARGIPRPQDADGDGTATPDPGAVEFTRVFVEGGTINEDAGTVDVTVRLSGPYPDILTTPIFSADDQPFVTATRDADFRFTEGQSVSFEALSTTPQTFQFEVIDDTEVEPTEVLAFFAQAGLRTENGFLDGGSFSAFQLIDNDIAAPDLSIVQSIIQTRVPDDRTDGDPNDDLINTSGPFNVTAGGFATIALEVFNAGSGSASGVELNGQLPIGVTLIPGSFDAGGGGATIVSDGRTYTITLPDFSASQGDNDAAGLTFEIAFDPSVGGQVLVSDVAVTSQEVDSDEEDNTSSITFQPNAQVDVILTLQAPATVTAGGDLTYTLTLNQDTDGLADADFEIRSPLPAGVEFVSVDAPGSISAGVSDGVLIITYEDLPVEQSRTATVVVNVPADLAGTLQTTAQVFATDPALIELDSSNNSATAETTIVANQSSDLSIFIEADELFVVNQELRLRGRVTNSGNDVAIGASVGIDLPPGLVFVSGELDGNIPITASGRQITFPIGDVDGFDPDTFNNEIFFDFVVGFDDSLYPGGGLTIAGSVLSRTPETDPSNNSTSVTVSPLRTATLRVGDGDGETIVNVDAFGNFGVSSGSLGGSSGGNARLPATFDPIGAAPLASTTFASSLAIGNGRGGRQFLDNQAVEQRRDIPLTGTSTRVSSSFVFGELTVELIQTLQPSINANGEVIGSRLDQTYTFTTQSGVAVPLDIIRYLDADLQFDGSIVDGGGRLIDAQGVDVLFEVDRGGDGRTDSVFVGITDRGGELPGAGRFEINQFPVLRQSLPVGDELRDEIFGDLDGDGFIDAGQEYDVELALRRLLAVNPGEAATYTATTFFGQRPTTVVPPIVTPAALTGHVFCDANGNGVEESGETGAGQTVFIDVNGNRLHDVSELSQTTDDRGDYTFATLPPGLNEVVLVLSDDCRGVPERFGTVPLDLAIGDIVREVAMVDLDGDGSDELIAASDRDGAVSVTGADGSRVVYPVGDRPQAISTWTPRHLHSEISTPVTIAVALAGGPGDDGIGRGGVVSITNGIATRLATGDGPLDVVVDDFNGDDQPDYVTANFRSGDFTLRLSPGGEVFQLATAPLAGRVAAGDFNGDGFRDLALGSFGSGTSGLSLPGILQIRFGDGAGGFTPGPNLSVPGGVVALHAAAMTTSGNEDQLLVASGGLLRMFDLSDGTFDQLASVALGANITSIKTADLNRDARPDVIAVQPVGGGLAVLLGDGLGGLAIAKLSTRPSGVSDVAVGDFDGDGQPEAIIAALTDRPSGETTLLRLRASESFANIRGSITARVDFVPSSDVRRLDVNRDGRISALDALRIINGLNDSDSATAAQATTPDVLVTPLDVATDVDGDGRTSAIDALRIINHLNRAARGAMTARAEPLTAGAEVAPVLGEGGALPGEAPTLPLEDSREGEGEAYPRGIFQTEHLAKQLPASHSALARPSIALMAAKTGSASIAVRSPSSNPPSTIDSFASSAAVHDQAISLLDEEDAFGGHDSVTGWKPIPSQPAVAAGRDSHSAW